MARRCSPAARSSAWRWPARWSASPPILALDEPLGALDALTRIEMQELLERVWRGQGFTAVLVTHDVAEAVALADRVVVLDAGRIALDLAIPLPRPRRHGAAEVARLKRGSSRSFSARQDPGLQPGDLGRAVAARPGPGGERDPSAVQHDHPVGEHQPPRRRGCGRRG